MTDTNIAPQTGADSQAGKSYWRSLDQLAATPQFQEILAAEFPEGAAEHSGLGDKVSRRKFLGVVAASVALAGLTSCRKPGRQILPFNQRPEGWTPGLPNFYATSLSRRGYGLGALVRSNEGRPTKVEGNPDHPGSLGGSDAWMQAEVLQLFDPARSQRVLKDGAAEEQHDHADDHGHAGHSHAYGFDGFAAAWQPLRDKFAGNGGKGLAFLLQPSSSPSLMAAIDEARARFPQARFHLWSPVNRESVAEAGRIAFGQPVDAQYDFSKAEVVASFDSDFLGTEQCSLQATRSWAESRKITDRSGRVSRLYAVESAYTVTGSNADNRFRLSSAEIGDAVLALAAELGVGDRDAGLKKVLDAARAKKFERGGKDWITVMANDLRGRAGAACVVVGERQPAHIQAAGYAINQKLAVVGDGLAVRYTAMPRGIVADPSQGLHGIGDLVDSIHNGAVECLFVLGGNPVYDAPADLGFAEAYAKLPYRIHSGLYVDETAQASGWHLPATHDLEEWGDLQAFDGTVGIVQPLIAPLYADSRSTLELLAGVTGLEVGEGYQRVRKLWAAGGNEAAWKQALHDGLVAGSAAGTASAALRPAELGKAVADHQLSAAPSATELELNIRPCPSVFDGRYSNNAWMQELPTPIEKLTWDNAVLCSRRTAESLGVYNGDVVSLELDGRSVEGAVWIQPGHSENALTVYLGYGRKMAKECEVADGAGFDAYPLRTQAAPFFARGVKVTNTGATYQLVPTQDHGALEGRSLVRETTLKSFQGDKSWTARQDSPLAKAAKLNDKDEGELLKSMWTERRYDSGYQWGMVIDLSSCTGCGSCVIACVSENNIPAVGKQQVGTGREMHWNRMDRYFGGEAGHATQDGVYEGQQLDGDVAPDDEPEVLHQMVPCMQCENAPCESVCPVGATMHSPEGLNDMAYNRCIGTRYCSNNCPFKVRRFNWFNFHKGDTQQEALAFNPNVTVRARGVMEKCTYCVQRINAGKLQAKLNGAQVKDGDIRTACQQSCPAQAIDFGNIVDPESRVHQLRGEVDAETGAVKGGSPLNYAMLSEYNLKPRTTYLAKVRNPNPELS